MALELPGVVSVTLLPTTDECQDADGVGLLTFASVGDMERALDSETARPKGTVTRRRPLPAVDHESTSVRASGS
jgi:hypothetical protein